MGAGSGGIEEWGDLVRSGARHCRGERSVGVGGTADALYNYFIVSSSKKLYFQR